MPDVPRVAAVVLSLGLLLAFAGVAALAMQPGVPGVDTAASTLLRDLASPPLDAIMRAVTGLGSTVVLGILVIGAALVLARRGDITLAAFLVLAFVGTLVLNDSLKSFLARPRPGFAWAEVRPEASFPSGHAMNAFVVYVALALCAWRVRGRSVGIAALVLAIGTVVAVGITRVYLGVHWLTDVVAGPLAGAAWLLLAAAVVAHVGSALDRRVRPSDPGPRGGDP